MRLFFIILLIITILLWIGYFMEGNKTWTHEVFVEILLILYIIYRD